MALSVREQRLLDEIAERIAAEDPAYARRMAEFGGDEHHDLRLPGRWVALPAAMLAIALLAMIALFFAVSSQTSASDGARVHHAVRR